MTDRGKNGTGWGARPYAVAVLVLLAALLAAVWPLGADAALVAGFIFPVVPRSLGDLQERANPSGGSMQGMSEAVPWVWFDTLEYESATTRELVFFSEAKSDRSLSNMPASGQLTQPQYFEMYFGGFDVLEPVTSEATGGPGAWDDVQQLVLTGRGIWNFEMSDKNYGPFPTSFLHQSGGVNGYGYNEAAAGTVKSEYAVNSIFDGGFPWNGSVIIPPSTGWNITMRWPAALTLVENRLLRCWIAGTLHRRIL